MVTFLLQPHEYSAGDGVDLKMHGFLTDLFLHTHLVIRKSRIEPETSSLVLRDLTN